MVRTYLLYLLSGIIYTCQFQIWKRKLHWTWTILRITQNAISKHACTNAPTTEDLIIVIEYFHMKQHRKVPKINLLTSHSWQYFDEWVLGGMGWCQNRVGAFSLVDFKSRFIIVFFLNFTTLKNVSTVFPIALLFYSCAETGWHSCIKTVNKVTGSSNCIIHRFIST